MRTFTQAQKESIMAQGKVLLEHMAQGQDARELAAQMYVKALDDKTMRQGYLMADAILDGVRQFDSDYRDAQEDVDRFIRKFQKQTDEGKTPAQRCTYWLRFTAVLCAASAAVHDAQEEMQDGVSEAEKIAAMEVTQEEATPQYEAQLHQKALEALKSSGLMLSGLIEYAKSIEEMGGDQAAGFLIGLGKREADYRAIVSMLAYTKIKSGEYENIPADMTLRQITALVCAEIERVKILDAVASGRMAEETATLLLTILGCVLIADFCLMAAIAGVEAIITAFGLALAVPVGMIFIAGICHLLFGAMEDWAKDSETIVKTASVLLRKAAKGALALAQYLEEHVIRNLVKACRTLYASLKRQEEETPAETITDTDSEVIVTP